MPREQLHRCAADAVGAVANLGRPFRFFLLRIENRADKRERGPPRDAGSVFAVCPRICGERFLFRRCRANEGSNLESAGFLMAGAGADRLRSP